MMNCRQHQPVVTLVAMISVTSMLLPGELAAAPPARPFSGASWIWNSAGESGNEPRYFRRTFELSAKPSAAELQITADNRYAVYVNGQKIGEDGAWQTVETHQVAKYLREGTNVLAVEAANAGGPAGWIAWLRIVAAEQEIVIGTDAKTRVSLASSEGWTAADFDDAQWAGAAILGPASMGPWNILGGSNAGGGGSPGTSSVADRNLKDPLSADEQRQRFLVPEGFEVELVAAEPLLINPVTMTVDAQGRIYVSESHTYRFGPNGSPITPFKNPLVRLDPLPDGKGYRRVLVAEGFEEPVMGIAVRGDQLWCTACDYLYQYDLQPDGQAVNRRTLLIDKNKAWNPFGMYVLEWGPEGALYLSVGNHNIDIRPPGDDGKPADVPALSGRGSSGIVMRMNPDGSQRERLVHGLRVPYSFEFDSYGQLWLLSNGEGNPNRFVRVIDGADYHCYSRNVPQHWLRGEHPLAPPCFELPAGAHTQLLRYYGAAWPAEYQGSLLLDNWGQHGFAGNNRSVFRYTTDERNNIVEKEALVSCADPRFRCSHIALDNDGNLLVADWYGRDDESDLTGRIWRLKYTGAAPLPEVKHRLDAPEWNDDAYAISALGSPHHRIREEAIERLQARGAAAVEQLSRHAAAAEEPLGAANALWTLLRIDTPQSRAALAAGAKHPDWRVRRLAINLLRRYQVPAAVAVAARLANDPDPAVRVEAALAQADRQARGKSLVAALRAGAAADPHLRYEAAWHLARHADRASLEQLLNDADADIRLAGLIAVDVARFEGFDTAEMATSLLAQRLADPGLVDIGLLLDMVSTHPHPAVAAGLQALIARTETPVAAKARALLVLRSLPGGVSEALLQSAGTHLLAAVEKGEVRLESNADWLLLLKLIESRGPSEFTLQQLSSLLGHGDKQVREAAHALARSLGQEAAPLAATLWPRLLDGQHPVERRLEILGTLAAIEPKPALESWRRLLSDAEPAVRLDAVRSWRAFAGKGEFMAAIAEEAGRLPEDVQPDALFVLRQLKGEAAGAPSEAGKEKLAASILAELASLPEERKKTAQLLGRRVFERSDCRKCHTTLAENTPRAPSLEGIGKSQKPDYLVESVLQPSKIIKTGYETESLITRDGRTLSGVVREDGNDLRVFAADQETVVPKTEVEERTVVKVSLMPEGQERQLSYAELLDLIVWLASLK